VERLVKLNFEKLESKITKRLDTMVANAGNAQGYLARVVYPQFQQAQINQFRSAGDGSRDVVTSEGHDWVALTESYRYAKYWRNVERQSKRGRGKPYSYTQAGFLIATGTLFQSVVGTSSEFHRRIVTPSSIQITTTLPYAKHVAEKRPFMQLGTDTMTMIKRGLRDYLVGRAPGWKEAA
jgi:hypothetical protein